MSDNLSLAWAPDKLLYALFKALPVGVCITDELGNFVYVNEAYCRIYGYDSDELIGQSFLTVVPPENHTTLQELHDQFIIGNVVEVPAVWEVVNKRGKRMTIRATARRYQDERRKRYKITTVTDITEQLRLERMRKDAERVVRHDLKSPLNGVMGGAQLLRETGEFNEEQTMYLDAIMDSARQILYLVDQSMDWFSMEEGAYRLKPTDIDAVRLLTRLRSQFMDMARRKNISIHLQLNGAPLGSECSCLIHGEERLLEVMLANLVKNAIEASGQDATVTLEVRCDETENTISVHNMGTVPASIRPNLFDRYVTAGKKGGTGLGLYSAKLVATVHGGDLSCSTSEAEGTTFTARLPRPAEAAEE